MPLNGQSRRSQSLGGNDPRARRSAGGLVDIANAVSGPVGMDAAGRLTLVGGMRAGDVLRWDGKTATWVRQWNITPVKTAAYTAKPWEVVRCDPTAGGFTVTLPPSPGNAEQIIVKNASDSTNTITISPHGQDEIDDATSLTVSVERYSVWLLAIEGGWLEV
jgi:hypothetical protein